MGGGCGVLDLGEGLYVCKCGGENGCVIVCMYAGTEEMECVCV
jgi:hypothetical protein